MQTHAVSKVFDPGRGWRRVVRCGVLFFVFMLGVGSLIDGIPPWHEMQATWRVATTADGDAYGSFLPTAAICCMKVFACCFFTLYFSAPLLAIIATARIHRAGWRPFFAAVSFVLWLMALLPPYCFGVYQLNSIQSEELRMGILSGLSLYLLLGLMTLINAWRARRSAVMILWLCVYPISSTVVAMIALVGLQSLIGRPVTSGYFILAFVGLAGSVFFLTAFLKWWAAVRRAMPAERRNSQNESLKPNLPTAETL
jgi:hypothetical protein